MYNRRGVEAGNKSCCPKFLDENDSRNHSTATRRLPRHLTKTRSQDTPLDFIASRSCLCASGWSKRDMVKDDEDGYSVTSSSTSGRNDELPPNKHAATGAQAAGIRALSTQVMAFYFRAPIRAFFRTRVDYMAMARAVNPDLNTIKGWSLRTSSIGLLVHAVRQYGWRFIPDQVLPPMIANVSSLRNPIFNS